MSDTALNKIIQSGDTASRTAFIPDPAVGSLVLYIWYDTDDGILYIYESAAWVPINAAGGAAIYELTGDVTAGPGIGTQAATLAASGVTPGSYTSADITVDAKGRVTVAANGSGGSGVTSLTGDVTGTGPGATATTIANSAVTNAKMANMADQTIKGNDSGAPAAPQDLSANEVSTVLDGATDPFLRTSAATSGLNQLTGDVTAGPGTGSQAATLATKYKTRVITFVVGSVGGDPITTGYKGNVRIPVAATIVRWTILNNVSGSIEFDVFVDAPGSIYPPTTSIVAAAPPETTSDEWLDDTGLSGWDTSIAAQDVMGISVAAVDGVLAQSTLEIEVVVP